MSHCISVWILAWSLTGTSEAGAYAQPNWDELVTRLRAVDVVSGRGILFEQFFDVCGRASWEFFDPSCSKFFDLSQTMIRVGTEEDFHKLLSDDWAIVRCMGLLALAQVKGRAAAPVIRSYLGDTGEIVYCPDRSIDLGRKGEMTWRPGGCYGLFTTVGHFAWRLLLNTHDLEQADVPCPLLTDSERIGLEMELLAADSLVVARSDALVHLPMVMRDGTLILQLAALRGHAPTLEDYQIIKGIGRLKPSASQRDFLIACLRDRTLGASARLAAGSALTRHTDDISFRALRDASTYLNGLAERHWGDQFLATVQTRKLHEIDVEPLMVELAWQREPYREDQRRACVRFGLPQDEEQDKEALLAKRTWWRPEEIKDRFITACMCRHPLALNDLLQAHNLLYFYHAVSDGRCAAGYSLVEISRQLKDYSQPWSTYADSASLLALHIAEERHRAWHARILTDEQCDEIEKNIAEARCDKQGSGVEKSAEPGTAADGGA